jgi:hypothetical protein
MRTLRIVMPTPQFNHRPGMIRMMEQFHVQTLIPQLAVEALAVTVLPGTSRINVVRRRSLLFQPLLERLGDELRAIVAADEPWDTMQSEQLSNNPITPRLVIRVPACTLWHSRVNSSTTVSIFSFRPFSQWSCTKSYVHT